MRIERGGEVYLMTEDRAVDEQVVVNAYNRTVCIKHRITVQNQSKTFTHTTQGSTRAQCLLGLLHSGFWITREIADNEVNRP